MDIGQLRTGRCVSVISPPLDHLFKTEQTIATSKGCSHWPNSMPEQAAEVVGIRNGTAVKTRSDRKATSLSLLVALGVLADGQNILLAVKDMGGASEAALRALLDDLSVRGLAAPDFVLVDGAPGLKKALAGLWPRVPVQRCTVRKHLNLLAKAPERLHDEISADYRDMIYAETKDEVVKKHRQFLAN